MEGSAVLQIVLMCAMEDLQSVQPVKSKRAQNSN